MLFAADFLFVCTLLPLPVSTLQGPGLDGVEWWGVLGNHDYGGYHYNVHWDPRFPSSILLPFFFVGSSIKTK